MAGPPVTYTNAEVRGRLRAWKQKLARDYVDFKRIFRASRMVRVRAFVRLT
jgi:hypothetical protein